jgi:DinB superfamily
MAELANRIRDAGTNVLALRDRLEAAGPWPLSDHWGTEPEADWGPAEVLAHVAEMLPYWTGQLTNVVAGNPAAAVPFGRIASDPDRLARIDALRRRPVGEILDEIEAGLEETVAFVQRLSPSEADRLGLHPTRGELTVAASVERFIASHLEEHVVQLRAILDRSGSGSR